MTTITTIRLPTPVYERLRMAAFTRRLSQSKLVEAALEAYLPAEEEMIREVQDH